MKSQGQVGWFKNRPAPGSQAYKGENENNF